MRMGEADAVITSGFVRHARQNDEACAVRSGDTQITYGELYARSIYVSDRLRHQGLAGQRIAIRLGNGVDFLSAFYGVVLAGGIAVPLPADLPADQTEEWCGHLNCLSIVKEPSELPAKRSIAPNEAACGRLKPDSLFYMAVSSGSTGKPKGILRNHQSWVESFQRMKQAFGLGEKDVILLPGPLHYSASLIAALQILYEGGVVHVLDRYDSAAVLNLLACGEVTSCFMVPAMYAKLLAKNSPPCNHPITFLSAGDKLSIQTAAAWRERFPESRLFEYYGAAELSFVSYLLHDGQVMRSASSVGKPFPGVTVTIRDEHGGKAGQGEPGEVYVNSGMVAQGYGHFDAAPFLAPVGGGYSVGDLGYLDKEGELHLVGRKQELIMRGGVSIFPAEIERVLLADPLIREAAVFGVEDPEMGERIVAAITVAGTEANFPYAEMENRFQQRFPRSRRPDDYLIVQTLPRNAAGKTDKKRLKELYRMKKQLDNDRDPSQPAEMENKAWERQAGVEGGREK